jgi:hypothetical protein
MMNLYSKRWWAGAIVAAGLLGACGGSSDSSGGTAANKSDWDKKNAPVVKAVSIDVDESNTALDKGDRVAILSACNQLKSDVADARKGLPVPDATVDGALKAGLDSAGTAADSCVTAARNTAADPVEQAQRDMKAARTKLDDAQKAIAAWQ